LEPVRLLRLHDLDDMGLNDECALSFDTYLLFLLIIGQVARLLLGCLFRHDTHADRVRLVAHVERDELIVLEDGLLDLFLQDHDLWVA